ncbi:hypothetical protein Slit_2236 [Sideroxydans lithotrophicus ES-1]|uniref:Uncharacterized protein n=1 Tax=Sideroxydans lithotrophicus (strain ES-1) TaxID=580332 RepID=D5CUS7_SIDLE|nr:hypothetical protein Slit_2236 [Sideroxydans lithotrophicus ES-1]
MVRIRWMFNTHVQPEYFRIKRDIPQIASIIRFAQFIHHSIRGRLRPAPSSYIATFTATANGVVGLPMSLLN